MTDYDAKRDRVLKAAFECRAELTAYARSLLGNYSAAEDAVQDAMLVVVKKFDQFEEGSSILAWCRSIVRLEVLQANQRRQRERTLVDRLLDDAVHAAFEEHQSIQKQADAESWHDVLKQCLERLPERGRRVLKARFEDNLGYQQIGDHVGMSLEGVRKSLFRLKKQVRSCMELNLRSAK